MTTYLTLDGQKLFADNAAQLVRLMQEADTFNEQENVKEFMREYAERAKLHNHDAVIVTDTVQTFVDSLIRFGFLERGDE